LTIDFVEDCLLIMQRNIEAILRERPGIDKSGSGEAFARPVSKIKHVLRSYPQQDSIIP